MGAEILSTGINFIFYYGTSYFQRSGISNPFIISVITDVVNVCSTVPGLYLVEKWGRRPLLMFGAIGMSFAQIIVASVGTAHPDDQASNKVLIAFVCIYIFFFACSWGPCAWVVTGEIFPLKARARGLSMTTATNWLLNFAIAYATPYLVNPGPGNANLGSKVFGEYLFNPGDHVSTSAAFFTWYREEEIRCHLGGQCLYTFTILCRILFQNANV